MRFLWGEPLDGTRRLAQEGARAEEEQLARERCMLTKIFGWMLIGLFLFGCISMLCGQGGRVDLLLLLAGLGVKRGSQAWLRFSVFICAFVSFVGFVTIVSSAVQGEPLEGRNAWLGVYDLEYWTEWCLPVGVMLGLSILALTVLKIRRVDFWSLTARRWVLLLCSVVVLVYGGGAVAGMSRRGEMKNAVENIEPELQKIRHGVRAKGVRYDWQSLVQGLELNPEIVHVQLGRSPRGSQILVNKEDRTGDPDYSEFLQLGTGDWVQLCIWFIK